MKVFLALPSYTGKPHPKTLEAIAATWNALEARGDTVRACSRVGCCYIQMVRNDLVYHFRRSDCDKILWLDDDVEWKPEDALRLLDMDDDVCGAAYPLKQDEAGYPVVIFTGLHERAVLREDGCISAKHIPTGFMVTSRNAIEKMCEAYPQNAYRQHMDGELADGFVDLFPQGVHEGRWHGEDVAFCRLWREIGGRIWLVPDVTLTHHGPNKSYTGNYHEFLLRCPGGSKA